ncbi:glycerol-3-phosphate dehydrogenase [Alteromonadaceae bacterium Bs31]|nr:glycerol-3-phosphate dehydrogenase [Alteromonadaceae bacterium Bs31]
MKKVDITIIGGGINGVSVAAEAASRGLSTLLVHARDLASGASGTPVTLAGIHLRHLSAMDYFQLGNMLDELHNLQKTAPHLIDILPVTRFDGEALKERGEGLVERYFQGIKDKSFANLCNEKICNKTQSLAARLKPARLIITKALQAQKHGAEILSYTKLIEAQRQQNSWLLKLEDQLEKKNTLELQSTLVVNCGGWWANNLLENILKVSTRCRAREEHRTQFFFKNPGLDINFSCESDRVFKLENINNKSFYVYSASENLFAFGPRKCDQHGFEECVDLQLSFIDCWNNSVAKENKALTLGREHFVYKRKARMALIEDPCASEKTPLCEPLLDLNNPGKKAVMMNIFGADAALHKKIAQQALDVLQTFHGAKANVQFKNENLPGGDIDDPCLESYAQTLQSKYPALPATLLNRLSHNYGSLTLDILEGCVNENTLGEHFGHGLYEKEVRYLIDKEWAKSADDILHRRTMLGMRFSAQESDNLNTWVATYLASHRQE